MKKILAALAVALAANLAWAGIIEFKSFFGPSTAATAAASDNNHAAGTADVTIAAPGAGLKNCLTELDVTSAGAYTLNVLSAGTTVYALTLGASAGLVRDWSPETAPCAAANAALSIKVTTTSAGGYNINYAGYVR